MVTINEFSYVQLFSDVLSIITILLCFISKVPQIINILKMKNAVGMNIVGLLMELFSYTTMFSYNYRNAYALLTYMEYPIILVQELILILCVLYYNKQLGFASVAGAGVYFSMLTAFLSGVAPRELLTFLVPLCTPIGASSKVVQLLTIIRSKNSECISILTWFISAFTNLTRVFTIYVDSADFTLLLNFIVNVFLSSSIMFAAYYYKPPKTMKSD
ncbi:hypothetical protein RN001_010022 [Aquatica leii]|uniref:Solute carrier family 66 member 3 n=1 Tax=Aquatica leii TaxID=1421715 RepID=A0AAN7S8E2_9COLE|nr:hypothetical protein RN001_010022 [Aquatica leii]